MVDNRGVILLSVVIFLLTIALIGASLTAFLSSVNLAVRSTVDEAKAFYLAEAGIAHAINLLRSHADTTTELEQTIGPINLGEGTYTVKLDFIQSLIISTGRVGSTEKTVQLQYTAL